MDPHYTLTQLTVDFMRLRREVRALQGDVARLSGRGIVRSYDSQTTQTELTQAASGSQQGQAQSANALQLDDNRETIYSVFPEHSEADHVNFTASVQRRRPLDLSTIPRFPRPIVPQMGTDSEDDANAESDLSGDELIPYWLFCADSNENDPTDRANHDSRRAKSFGTAKRVTFALEDQFEPSTSKICIERHPDTIGAPEKVPFDLPRDPGAIQLYANPMRAIPHHEVYPNIKIAVTASGEHKTATAKFLLSKWSTGQQLHDKVRSHFGIPTEQDLKLAYLRYEMIRPNDVEMWNYGMRYFPAFVAQIPDDYQRGDLMEIEYLGKGPNINGDPTQVNPGRPQRAKRG